MTTPIAPGSRVKLNAPIGKLQRGAVQGPARLVIDNGAEGTVIGAGGKQSVIVGFDDLGGLSIGISVPIGWLLETPRERSADAELDRTEHRAAHQQLHDSLDELLADWFAHVKSARPSTSTVLELMQWSHQQTISPDEHPK